MHRSESKANPGFTLDKTQKKVIKQSISHHLQGVVKNLA